MAKTFHCTFHGKNTTHDSADCYLLKKSNNAANPPAKCTFTNKGLHQELNYLACSSSKEKVLEMYQAVLNKEKAKLKKKKKPKTEITELSDSDSDEEMAVIEQESTPKKRKVLNNLEPMEEELAFLKKVHAQLDSEESSDN